MKLYDPAKDGTSEDQLVTFYNKANKTVAILCNHQKAVGKNHEENMQKLKEKHTELKKTLGVYKKQLELCQNNQPLMATFPDTEKKLPQNFEGIKFERDLAESHYSVDDRQ